jgi:GntR family transcriptional regulator
VILEEGPTPLYFQIKSIIKSKILSNELKEEDLLPSEAELSKEYNVSRGTVRQAFSELIKEGLIYRARGKGTFVTEGAGLRQLRLKGTIENLITSAQEGRVKILEYKEVIPPSYVAKHFQLEITQHAFRLEVIFSIPKGPSRYTLFYFPPHLGKLILRNELKETTEVLLLVENKLQTKIHHASQTIDIMLADNTTAKYLSIAPRTPIFVIERHYFARDGSPMYLSISYCRPDLYKFKIELTRT